MSSPPRWCVFGRSSVNTAIDSTTEYRSSILAPFLLSPWPIPFSRISPTSASDDQQRARMVSQWKDTAWTAAHQTQTWTLSSFRSLAASLRRAILLSVTFRSIKLHRSGKRHALLLPCPHSILDGTGVASVVVDLFEEISSRLMCRIHEAHKNLEFWKARCEGSETQKVRFMLLERGPLAFIQGVTKLVRDSIWESSSSDGLVITAASEISKRMLLLTTLQYRLAVVLGEVYREADIFGLRIAKDKSAEAVSDALISLHSLILTLQGLYDLNKCNYDSRVDVEATMDLQLKGLPEDISKNKLLTEVEIYLCADLVRENMQQLDNFLALLMQNYRKPRKIVQHWLWYTGGAVGLALASGWIVQHSPLAGSNDIEIWLKQGGEAIVAFAKEHIEQPLMSIRDDLFETFRRRHHGAAELEDVQLTADSLHRMLKALTEQLKGKEIATVASEQEMMEIVMNRYEQEITHPLQNLLGGELFRAMLIQVQKLKLDIETAMLELNQILRANEINFAMLAALPALVFSVILVWLLRISLSQNKGAEGRGRAAQVRRRMLLAEVEHMILSYQILKDRGEDEEMQWHYGMTIYFLNQFYKAVERHAVASGEWSSLQRDIYDLAKPRISLAQKLQITARIERIYECIIPARPSRFL